MGAPKKAPNSFASYQEEKQLRRQNYIKAFLVIARLSRQKYDYVTDLAKAVAVHITESEKRDGISEKACNPSTLLRNSRYKTLLYSYLAENVSKGLKQVRRAKADLGPVAQSNALLADIESSNLRNENQRLKYHIAELERRLAGEGGADVANDHLIPGQSDRAELLEMERKFIVTCQVVSEMLTKLQDILVADVEKMRILDAAVKRGDNVIVDERLAAPFFEWLKKHASSTSGI